MSNITRLSTKGQVVIPQKIREELGITAEDTLQIEEINGMIVLKKITLDSLAKELVKGGRK